MTSRIHAPTSRLLNKTQAATYCGLNTQGFDLKCPVRPICLGGTTMRYDVAALDKWIDGLTEVVTLSPDTLLTAFGEANVRRSSRRSHGHG